LIINYYLSQKAEGEAVVTVYDIRGERVAQIKGPAEAGLNRLSWNMRRASGGPPTGGPQGGGGPLMPAGEYRVVLEAGGQQQTAIARIRERIQ